MSSRERSACTNVAGRHHRATLYPSQDVPPADHRRLIANHTRALHHLSIGILAAKQALRISSSLIANGNVAATAPSGGGTFSLHLLLSLW